MVNIFFKGDEEKIKICMDVYDQCQSETADEPCEAAAKISDCLKMHGTKHGITFIF
jgi:hypothetical protein